ncbi:Progestin and adipoQ receptor family member 6 [Exaiptasia diaphana]|nr:Progestin and adipoQ receptor family member 6 [Exaiptasia diaphana]
MKMTLIRESLTVRQCIVSLFSIHNETFNVWSHLLPAFGFMTYAAYLVDANGISDVTIYPLLCFAFGTCLMLFSSAFAHLFCCMSWRALHICFYIDYAAISVFSFTASQGYYFYSRPLSEGTFVLYRDPYVFLGVNMALSCTNMFISCMTWHRFTNYRPLVRTGLYVVKFLVDISPFITRCFSEQCNSNVTKIFNRQILWYAIAAIANAFQIPERSFPGIRFDILGNSHHFLHVFTALGNYDAFRVMTIDMTERRIQLDRTEYKPTFLNTFGFVVFLMLVNCSIVVWFVRKWLPNEEELLSDSTFLQGHQSNGNFPSKIEVTKRKKKQ